VGVGQQLPLGRGQQRQGQHQQGAVERLVEDGAGASIGVLVGLQVERDDYGVSLDAAASLEQLVQGDG
jgi:hypothetical protein